MPQPSTVIQERELRLAALPAGQGPLAMAWLGRLPGLEVSQNGPLTLTIRYAAGQYRMSELRWPRSLGQVGGGNKVGSLHGYAASWRAGPA